MKHDYDSDGRCTFCQVSAELASDGEECPMRETGIAERQPEQTGSMLPLIQTALERGIDPAKLEKMLDLQERWEAAQAQKAFGRAIAAFQAECPPVVKARVTKGGKWTFRFASLDDVMRIAQPILARHAISISFDAEHVHQDKGPAVINVSLRLRVGAYWEDKRFGCPIPTDLNASQPQQWGAALAYAKRYALCAALNIVVTEEDTDAANVVDTISARDMVTIERLIQETKTDIARFLQWASSAAKIEVVSLDELPLAVLPKALTMLRQKAGAKS